MREKIAYNERGGEYFKYFYEVDDEHKLAKRSMFIKLVSQFFDSVARQRSHSHPTSRIASIPMNALLIPGVVQLRKLDMLVQLNGASKRIGPMNTKSSKTWMPHAALARNNTVDA